MKVDGKTRAGFILALGVLVGLGLVTLPGFLAPSAMNSTSTNSNVGGPAPTYTTSSQSSGNRSNQSGLPSTASAAGSLAIIVGLVLFPAIALSILVRHWTLKSAKDRLEPKNR